MQHLNRPITDDLIFGFINLRKDKLKAREWKLMSLLAALEAFTYKHTSTQTNDGVSRKPQPQNTFSSNLSIYLSVYTTHTHTEREREREREGERERE